MQKVKEYLGDRGSLEYLVYNVKSISNSVTGPFKNTSSILISNKNNNKLHYLLVQPLNPHPSGEIILEELIQELDNEKDEQKYEYKDFEDKDEVEELVSNMPGEGLDIEQIRENPNENSRIKTSDSEKYINYISPEVHQKVMNNIDTYVFNVKNIFNHSDQNEFLHFLCKLESRDFILVLFSQT